MRHRSVFVAPILALIAGLFALLGTSPAQAYDRDCGDFDTQRAAQIFFLNNGGPQSDPHGLDAEGDGIACESNPCPCLLDTSSGGDEPATDGGTKQPIKESARVVRVIDGDTIEVRLSTGAVRDVRLIGIDTPEVHSGTECGGPEASDSLEKILPKGTRVTLISDTSQALKDRYGRILRYVHKAATGKDVNRQQVSKGWATVYVYNNNPFSRTPSYRTAALSARAADRGIWGIC